MAAKVLFVCCLSLLPFHEEGCANGKQKNCESCVGYGFGDADARRVEVEHYFVLASFHVQGTQNVIHTTEFGRLSVYGSRPTGIVNF